MPKYNLPGHAGITGPTASKRLASKQFRDATLRHSSSVPRGTSVVALEAIALHERGFWIVPCDGKKPIVPGWQDKRLDRDELLTRLKDPRLNIAIAINHSELVDVECDSAEAEDALLRMFVNAGSDSIPNTPTYKSKRGLHRYFRRPSGLPEKAKLELDRIEFRIGNGKGALSLVPPSLHPDGMCYHWLPDLSIHDVALADLPAAIVARLIQEPEKSTPGALGQMDVPEGERNDSLFLLACQLRDTGLTAGAVEKAILIENDARCKPPLADNEVRSILQSAMSRESEVKQDFLSALLREIELWHDENDDPFVTLRQDDHRENWPIGKRSKPFRRWLSKRVYEATGKVIRAQDLADYATLLEGKAVFDGLRYKLFRRTATHEGRIYLDLCDEKWRAMEVSENGWRVVDEPPVKFRRAKSMQALPIPLKPEGVSLAKLLLPFLNIRTEQWPLVAVWLAAALRPAGPYPILKLLGEQGSAKTTTARVLRALIDPNSAPVRSEPRDTRDLMIAANNGCVICLDNLSSMKSDLSDALCRMATGGGSATRTLYTDDEETIFNAQRPVILTSIEEIGTRSDLLERSLIIELPTISEESRRPEKTFWKEFEEARPRILGALLDVVSSALRRLPTVESRQGNELPRMADFHLWGEACEVALGLEPGTFAEAYAANRQVASQTVLESSPVVTPLLAYMRKINRFEGTMSEFLNKLEYIDSAVTRQPGWPKTPRVLSAILRRVAPNLRQVGVRISEGSIGRGNQRRKTVIVERTGDFPTPAPPATPLSKTREIRAKSGVAGAISSAPAITPVKPTFGRVSLDERLRLFHLRTGVAVGGA